MWQKANNYLFLSLKLKLTTILLFLIFLIYGRYIYFIIGDGDNMAFSALKMRKEVDIFQLSIIKFYFRYWRTKFNANTYGRYATDVYYDF